jgi:two-component system, OmpR family, heavy metal sensor histidine kinase CusS
MIGRLRTLRGRLTAVGVLVAVVAIGVLVLAFNLVLESSLDQDADRRLREQAAAAATTVGVRDGRLVVREGAGDGVLDRRVWVYEGDRAIERAPGDAHLQRTADALAGEARVFDDVPGRELRLYAAPVMDGSRQAGTIVTGLSLAAYDRTTDLAHVASAAFGVLMAGAVLALMWATTGRALAPVREMTRSAAEWSERDPARRFGAAGRPDELGELARTFDALLDRVAASLRHEQRVSAELSHELRTPLARIVAQVELLQRRDRSLEARSEAYASIAHSAEQMNAILETLMTAARADAGLDQGRSDLRGALAEIRREWAPVLAERGVALEVREPRAPLVAGLDADVVERILAPLLENASRFARTRVLVEAGVDNGAVVVTIDDDGPGVPAGDRERIFEPGASARGGAGHAGAGLGLALARRLARAAHGEITAEDPAPGAGARFRVQLPR